MIAHIDQGFDFLGMRIQRHRQRASARRFVYTYPSRAALAAVKAKCAASPAGPRTSRSPSSYTDSTRCCADGPPITGTGLRPSPSAYLSAFTWRRVWCWLCHKHHKIGTGQLRRRHLRSWWPERDGVTLFNPAAVAITRYCYRRAAIPSRWATPTPEVA